MQNSGQLSPEIIQVKYNTSKIHNTCYGPYPQLRCKIKRHKKWGTLNMNGMEIVAFQEAGCEIY